MSTPEPPTTTTSRSRWRRPRGRGLVIGASLLALLIVAGVAFALLAPWRDGPGRGFGDHDGRPGLALAGEDVPFADLDDEGRGPWGGPNGRGPGRGGEGLFDLGSDTVLTGSVVSVGNGTLVVTVDGPVGSTAQRALRTDGDTRVAGAGNAALGDLQTGERVAVRVAGTGDAATAVAVLAPQARVTGTVTALDGDRATVVGVDGLTVVANVAALGTKPAVGDVVMITGTVTDGVTLTADGIRVLPRAS